MRVVENSGGSPVGCLDCYIDVIACQVYVGNQSSRGVLHFKARIRYVAEPIGEIEGRYEALGLGFRRSCGSGALAIVTAASYRQSARLAE